MAETTHPLILASPDQLPEVLFSVMNDGVIVVDAHGVILDCNPAFYRRLGYTREALLGRTVVDLDTPEYAARVKERLAQIHKQGRVTFETAHVRADGTVMPVEISARYCEVDGQTLFFGIVRDITERKQLEAELKEGLEVYRAAINTPALGFWVVDRQGRFLEVNDAYLTLSGFSRDELLDMAIPDIEAAETPEETARHIEQVMRDGYARFRTRHRCRDGSVWPVEVVASYSSIHGGRFFVFLEDIREKQEQERRLELAARVFESMEQAVVVTDADNKIVSINPAVSAITGYTLDEVRGRDPKIFSSGRHDTAFYADMWGSLQTNGHWAGEIWDRRKDGGVYAKYLTITAIPDSRGEVSQYVSIFSDITERKKAEELIWHQANYDSLTGLANRALFHNTLQKAIEQSQRDESRLAVLYVDLDGFKDVNDSLGHAFGDRLLMEVALRLSRRVRKSDLVARLGGDEFTLLIHGVTHPEQIGSLAEELLQSLRQPFRLDVHSLHVGASIGIALCPDDGATLEALTKHADTAMYQAKESGKNTFRFFRPEMNTRATRRLSMIHDLHQAVETGQFELYFQPKFSLADQRVVGMEALLRWPRDDGSMVSPADFIPCAEETGLIQPLGGWALAEACRRTAEWNRRYGSRLRVAVNLSARQFYTGDLLQEVVLALEHTGLDAELLELEITESLLIKDVGQAIELMIRLRESGVSIAIDDFGTGYSSLSYLKRFPINQLKIDQSFVRELMADSEDTAIIRAIISLAHSLDLEVVAEGVETPEQLEFLRRHECDMAQGYLLARPLSISAFEAFLDQYEQGLLR